MKKNNALKRAARWVAKSFGYKSETLFGKIMWRVLTISATIVTLSLAVIIVCLVAGWVVDYVDDAEARRNKKDPCYLHPYGNVYVSPFVIHHSSYDCHYLYNVKTGRRTATDVYSVCHSDDGDSLSFYSDGHKRGYFNRFTGEVVVPARYEKAWVYSDGVACVMENSEMQFLDHSGKTLLEKPFPYTPKINTYCFHHGLCAMMGDNERIGLTDKHGHWVVDPEYKQIDHLSQGLWKVWDKYGCEGLLNADGNEILPCRYFNIEVDDCVTLITDDHREQIYDLRGVLINPCVYQEVIPMEYDTDQFEASDYYDVYNRKPGAAHLMKYLTSEHRFGLIDKDGNILTPPLYDCIYAIAADRYVCEDEHGAVILDDKGLERQKKL